MTASLTVEFGPEARDLLLKLIDAISECREVPNGRRKIPGVQEGDARTDPEHVQRIIARKHLVCSDPRLELTIGQVADFIEKLGLCLGSVDGVVEPLSVSRSGSVVAGDGDEFIDRYLVHDGSPHSSVGDTPEGSESGEVD